MNLNLVLNTLGKLLLLIGGCMVIPLCISYAQDGVDFVPFEITFIITILTGLFLRYMITPENKHFSYREAFAISVFAWFSIGFFSCLPMVLTDVMGYQALFHNADQDPSFIVAFINSYFEAISGITATAATIVTDIEALPDALLFWRCFQNWLGGMGIIVLFVAILPSLGTAGSKLFRSEASFSVSESQSAYPKIADMAKMIWLLYSGLSIILLILLLICGMTFFDAICHTFSAMATGGFSSKNASVGYFNSIPIEIIIILFMLINGMNYMLIRQAFYGKIKSVISNTEFKVYISILTFAVLTATIANYFFRTDNSFLSELRETSFNIISMGTSTGLSTGDYDQWSAYSKIILIMIMIIGGCGGSTTGGLKVIRAVIFFKWIQREFKRMINPHGVFPILIKENAIENKTLDAAVSFTILYILTILGFGLLLSVFENDVITCFTGALACISNMGPGFGIIGPTDNYASLALPTKFILTIAMVIGRLELMAFYLLFTPKVWTK
ncbi:MAG: hypothetical protein COA79_15320 [Planctomycetota bacterium]|nr:MAG: hypothetical protein COA79_15320 [Planctomycetota bacterium]